MSQLKSIQKTIPYESHSRGKRKDSAEQKSHRGRLERDVCRPTVSDSIWRETRSRPQVTPILEAGPHSLGLRILIIPVVSCCGKKESPPTRLQALWGLSSDFFRLISLSKSTLTWHQHTRILENHTSNTLSYFLAPNNTYGLHYNLSPFLDSVEHFNLGGEIIKQGVEK